MSMPCSQTHQIWQLHHLDVWFAEQHGAAVVGMSFCLQSIFLLLFFICTHSWVFYLTRAKNGLAWRAILQVSPAWYHQYHRKKLNIDVTYCTHFLIFVSFLWPNTVQVSRKTAHFALCLQPPGKPLSISLKLTGWYTFHICYMELWSLLGH